ncbi:MAG: ABC transporter ATP-binding protein [Saccharospirillum sp.]|nr:ABC transporter ATP-binding protein [Saccharospirillum sp.]
MIELIGVSKTFNGRTAVDAIDLTIPKGSICVLVGTSGCGKSTTLRMINRLLPHDAGIIRIDGQEIRSFNEQKLRQQIGYAIQSTGLFPHWTVERNIGLVPRLLRWPKQKIQDRVEELMTLLDLDPAIYARQYPRQLSGGQAQRVGVARALAGNPETLLMDEPFGALDPITRDNLQNELLRIQAQVKKTIVFVTHDIDEALKLASQIVVMDQGRIVQVDHPEQLLRHPANAYVENLFGSQDRGLKLASLFPVRSLFETDTPIQANGLKAPGSGPEDCIEATDSLRLALSKMLWAGASEMPVVDANGQVLGQLTLEQILRANGK